MVFIYILVGLTILSHVVGVTAALIIPGVALAAYFVFWIWDNWPRESDFQRLETYDPDNPE